MNSLFFKEEHKVIKEMVRDFAITKIAPVARELDSKEIFPKELVTEMGELGLMGVMVPEEYGGSGLDMTAFTAAIIELTFSAAKPAILSPIGTASAASSPVFLKCSNSSPLRLVILS